MEPQKLVRHITAIHLQQCTSATLKHVKTLLLDVDGTLIDSYPGIITSFVHALDQGGHPRPSEDFLRSVPGPPLEVTLNRLGLTPEDNRATLRRYMEHYDTTGWTMSAPYPGIRDLLVSLKDQGFQLCTATSKSQPITEKILEHHKLAELFTFIGAATGPDGGRRSKRDVIAHVLDNVGLDEGSDILMIGDRIHDITGAAEFNIPTVAVTWGYGNAEEHQHAHRVADTPAEIERIIHDWAH